MATVCLLGYGGLGHECEKALLEKGFKVATAGHDIFDISDTDDVKSLLDGIAPDLVVNTAAFTAVDKAEDEKERAFAVNAQGAGYVANWCSDHEIPLIHISTDYVFSTPSYAPHAETEVPRALCVYGESKLEGERLVTRSGCRGYIIRTSALFGRYNPGFAGQILNKLKQGGALRVVSDTRICPTPAHALADAVALIAKRELSENKPCCGIYHFAGAPDTTWFDFAQRISWRALALGLIEKEPVLMAISSDEYGSKAQRPLDSRLSCARIEKVFGISAPSWEDYIDETLQAQTNA